MIKIMKCKLWFLNDYRGDLNVVKGLEWPYFIVYFMFLLLYQISVSWFHWIAKFVGLDAVSPIHIYHINIVIFCNAYWEHQVWQSFDVFQEPFLFFTLLILVFLHITVDYVTPKEENYFTTYFTCPLMFEDSKLR